MRGYSWLAALAAAASAFALGVSLAWPVSAEDGAKATVAATQWADPDLGGFTDDLVGCDTTLSLGYCYNATNNDQLYGSTPPAVGYDFFLGPVTAAGDTLGLVSFNKYINGTDPASPDEVYNYMNGRIPSTEVLFRIARYTGRPMECPGPCHPPGLPVCIRR